MQPIDFQSVPLYICAVTISLVATNKNDCGEFFDIVPMRQAHDAHLRLTPCMSVCGASDTIERAGCLTTLQTKLTANGTAGIVKPLHTHSVCTRRSSRE